MLEIKIGVVDDDSSFLCGTDSAKVNIKKKLVKEFNLHTIVRLSGGRWFGKKRK